MKITGYTQQVTNVSGSSSSAPTISSSAVAKAATSDVIDMTPVAKGLNSWADAIQKVHDQEDNENVMKAMDAYNKARFASMYNEENGLMNAQADGANGITDGYLEQEKKYRAEILGAIKLHNRTKQAALDDMMNKSAQQGYQLVAKHQFQQKEKSKDIDLNNNVNNFIKFAQKNWNNPDMVNVALENSSLVTAIRYSGVDNSDILKDQAKRKAYGMVVGSVIDAAMQNEDYATADKYCKEYGQYLTPAQLTSANKVIYAKAKSQWESNFIKDAYAKYGKDANAFRESLKGTNGFSMSSGAVPEQAEGTTWKRMNDNVSLQGLFPKTRKGLDVAAKIYSELFPGEKLLLTSGTDGTHETHKGESIDVNDDWGKTILADKGNRDKFKAALSAQGIRVLDEYEEKTKYQTGPHLHLEFNDFEESGGIKNQPMSSEEQDSLVKQYMTYANTEKRIKNMANDQSNDAFFNEVYKWATEGSATMEQALAEARKRSGGDRDLMRDFISTVHLCYNKANGGSGGTGNGNGAGKAASSYLIDQAKTLLRNGMFNSQQEYVDYIGNGIGGNLNQVWKAREDYNDFKKSAGEFKFDLGNMVNGAMTDKFTGKDKLSGTDKAMLAAGVRMYVGKKIAEFRMKNKRDPEMTEVGPMIDEALTSNVFTYQTPGKYFKAWLTDNEFNLTPAEMQTMGIDSIQPVQGQNDWYIVRKSNGQIIQTNGATLQSMKNRG